MSLEFKKISDVEMLATVTETSNVLVEDGGVIKKVEKSKIGAQADWDETDETSPAFILNKPVNLGNGSGEDSCVYYCINRNQSLPYIQKATNPYSFYDRGESNVTKEEFENDYRFKRIMLLVSNSGFGAYEGLKPLLNFYYNTNGSPIVVYSTGYGDYGYTTCGDFKTT